MNINTLSTENNDYKSGSLPIALYPNAMRREADGKQTYFARPTTRSRLSMENIANDMVVTGVNNGMTVSEILSIWNNINNAVLDRVANSFIVDAGLGVFTTKVNGTFETDSEPFNSEKHSIDMTFRTSKFVKDHFSKLDVVIRQGNTTKPQISDIYDLESKGSEFLTKGGFLEITGSNLTIAGTDSSVGLYFINTIDDTKSVKLEQSKIGTNTSTRLACVIPATLADGEYQIKVVTQFSKAKTLRKEPLTFVFDKHLTVVSANG